MPRILTVTANPALDLSTSTAVLSSGSKLRCAAPLQHPGGGGINVARVVRRLGGDACALLCAGGPAGEALVRLLQHEQVPVRRIAIGGETRSNWTVVETSTGREFRFVMPGPALTAAEVAAVEDALNATQPVPTDVVLSGSLPPGMPQDWYARLIRLARAQGCRVALDASGPDLALALRAGVDIVKPSLHELEGLAGRPLDTARARLDAARALVASGAARLVALTLGAQGALLVGHQQALAAEALAVPVAGTVGAGDTFLAALVLRLAEGLSQADALAAAVAASAATVLHPGTALCTAQDAARLRASVRITALP